MKIAKRLEFDNVYYLVIDGPEKISFLLEADGSLYMGGITIDALLKIYPKDIVILVDEY